MSEHRYGSGDLLSIDLWCPECKARSWVTIPKTEASYEARWDCPDCGAAASLKRIPSAPMVAKASYPDGYKRAGFQELKEASSLRVDSSAGLSAEDTVKVNREIDRLEGRNK
jgi:transposase-like protein